MQRLSAILLIILILFDSCTEKKNKETTIAQQDNLQQIVSDSLTKEEDFDFSDFNDLKNNKHYDRFLAGQLTLPTGQVVCTDPMYRELGLPQSWTVAKGIYPVYLYFGIEEDNEGRIGYAELIFKDEIPATWNYSLISENLLADKFEKQMNGMYPVENGLSCFTDFETYKIYEQEIKAFYLTNKNGNYYNAFLEKRFDVNSNIPRSSRGSDWINYKPEKATGNIMMFASGYGDGLYPRYAGYDKNGTIVKLVTDFTRSF